MTDILEPVDIPVDDTEPCPVSQMTDTIAALMMQRLASHARRIRRAEGIAEALLAAETARVNDWLARETKRDREAAEQIQARLEEWIRDVRAATAGRVMSKCFPHGAVQTREVGGGWKVEDEGALLSWAKASRPDLVQVRESFKVVDAKKATSRLLATDDGQVVTEEGEHVPGITVEPKGIKATVVLGGAS